MSKCEPVNYTYKLDIQDKINKFFEQYGKNKIKQINGFCFKGKKKCPHTVSGKCRGWCCA